MTSKHGNTMEAVPVIDITESCAPEFGSVVEVVIPPIGALPVQLIPRRPSRHRARINIDSISGTSSSLTSPGDATTPAGPGTVIDSITAPVTGTYQISVTTRVAGATGADQNNMALNIPGLSALTLPTATAGDQIATSPVYTVSLKAGQTVTVTQIAASTATSYYAIIQASYTGTNVVYVGTDPAQLSNPNAPGGGQITVAPRQIIWESQRPLYALASASSVNAYVQDESYDRSPAPAEDITESDDMDEVELDNEYAD